MGLELDGVNGIIKNTTSDGDVTIKGNDGGSEISLLTFDVSAEGVATFNKDVKLGDNSKALFGADSDFEIYHSGTASIIREASAGNLTLAGNDVQVTNGAMNETHIDCNNNGSVDLYHNNVKKFETTASGVDITGGFNATVGSTITTADNTDTLQLISTDADPNQGPNLRLYRNNDSNANDDILGQISFDGRNNNSQDVEYAFIRSFAGAITDGSENGVLDFRTIVGGTERNRISMDPSSTTINEEGIDLDFRVESNGNANMLFVDAGNDKIGVGTNSPQELMHLMSTATAAVRVSGGSNNNKKVEIGYNNTDGPYIKSGSSGVVKLQFYIDNNTLAAEIRDNADFYTNDGTVHSLSDARVKSDINDLTDGLEIVKQLKPRTFKYTSKSQFYSEKNKDEIKYGFVADEVEAVASQYTSIGTGKLDGETVDDLKSISATKMIPMLVKAIQELEARITALEG